VREFVETYDLSQSNLVDDFLNGELPARDLAARYHAPLDEVEEIVEALGRMRIVETLMDVSAHAAPSPPTAAAPSRARQQARPVAKVFLTDHNKSVAIQFTDDSVYSQRYRTSPDAVRRVADISDRDSAERLLLELQWINQRKTLLCRLVMAVCNFQYRYYLTGALIALKPLSQADMARELGEDEATVCRLLRDKFVDTPYGLIELKFLFQKKTDVIRRIVRQHPELTDNEVREVLADDYGTAISRRTVAYHRLKFQRGGS
jgi:DNA-directed RNA polymerase specialized sigma54-like protein